jgi:hypothetical protein
MSPMLRSSAGSAQEFLEAPGAQIARQGSLAKLAWDCLFLRQHSLLSPAKKSDWGHNGRLSDGA